MKAEVMRVRWRNIFAAVLLVVLVFMARHGRAMWALVTEWWDRAMDGFHGGDPLPLMTIALVIVLVLAVLRRLCGRDGGTS
ncbi:hypothetical protein PHYC_02044 [Phycisphaerales bacterium]|nr:hypothetical protein PHYC_02044 [Phycisphaerales bacterium]